MFGLSFNALSAGRALGGGFGAGSGFGRALSARDFGLTSMQIQNQGLAQAQNFIQQQRTMGMAQPFSVSSMFITPAQRIGFDAAAATGSIRDETWQRLKLPLDPSPMQQAFGSAHHSICRYCWRRAVRSTECGKD